MTVSASWKCVATLTACWPVAASATSRTSCGATKSRSLSKLLHQRLIDLLPPGGIVNLHIAGLRLGPDLRGARGAPARPFRPAAGVKTGTPICRPSVASCSMAAGRCKSHAISSGWRPCFFSQLASFAEEVVLPAPFRPTMRMRVRFPSRFSGEASPPSRAVSSSWKILTIC